MHRIRRLGKNTRHYKIVRQVDRLPITIGIAQARNPVIPRLHPFRPFKAIRVYGVVVRFREITSMKFPARVELKNRAHRSVKLVGLSQN
jgi:hypothetical protein